MDTIKLLVLLYFINFIKNITDYDRVFKLKSFIYNRDNKDISKELQTTTTIKLFILTLLFQTLIIYLLLKGNDFEAKPLILISYGLALPIYTIEYYANSNFSMIDIIIYIIQCITSTLAIYLVWSKKTITSAIIIGIVSLLIMLLPLIINKLTNQDNIVDDNIIHMIEEDNSTETIVEEENSINSETNNLVNTTNPQNNLYC